MDDLSSQLRFRLENVCGLTAGARVSGMERNTTQSATPDVITATLWIVSRNKGQDRGLERGRTISSLSSQPIRKQIHQEQDLDKD